MQVLLCSFIGPKDGGWPMATNTKDQVPNATAGTPVSNSNSQPSPQETAAAMQRSARANLDGAVVPYDPDLPVPRTET